MNLTHDIEYIGVASKVFVDGGEEFDSQAFALPRLKDEELTDARAKLERMRVVAIDRRVSDHVVDWFPVHDHFFVTEQWELKMRNRERLDSGQSTQKLSDIFLSYTHIHS